MKTFRGTCVYSPRRISVAAAATIVSAWPHAAIGESTGKTFRAAGSTTPTAPSSSSVPMAFT